jgi:hypothetical protein
MEENLIKYKNKNGKKLYIFPILNEAAYETKIDFVVLASNKEQICTLTFQIDYSYRNKLYPLLNNKSLKDTLFILGLKKVREKINSDDFRDGVMIDDTIVAMIQKNPDIYSPEEIVISKLKVQQDILACLYEKDRTVNLNELIDYVWTDDDLLIEELSYLQEEKLISCMPEVLNKEHFAKGDSVVVSILTKGRTEYQETMQKGILGKLNYLKIFEDCVPFASNKIVFLAHSFGEEELIKIIENKLTEKEFSFTIGKVEDLSSITEDILNKIRESGFFVALLTPKKEFKEGGFSAGPWILMEIGAALAYRRTILILSEDVVDKDQYEAKLQGNHEYINFNRDNFSVKVDEAISKIINERKKYQER